eukprot:7263348-Lingulodinium_polyedra.AAC.1
MPETKSTRTVFRPRNGTSGRPATSAPNNAIGMTLPRARRALPTGSLGGLAAALATAAAWRKQWPRVTATRRGV